MEKIYPDCFKWTTFGVTTLIEKLWESQRDIMLKGLKVSPYIVELSSVLERALNVAHTGNVRVIATSLMNPLLVGRSLLDHGTPTFSQSVIMGHTAKDSVFITEAEWPCHSSSKLPLTSSKRSQIFNYGINHWEVSLPIHLGRGRHAFHMAIIVLPIWARDG